MAEEMEGEEFVVDKILDKRVRNGKIEYYLSWKVGFWLKILKCSIYFKSISTTDSQWMIMVPFLTIILRLLLSIESE